MKRHIIQCLVENKFGVLARIASLFSARGYNIKSLTVGETNDPTVSCLTMVVNAEDEGILEQIQKQLNKLIDVITVKDITSVDHVEKELFLVRVNYTGSSKDKIDALASKYTFKVSDVKEMQAVIAFSGSNQQVEQFLGDIGEIGILELVRSGKIAIVTS